MDNQNKIRPDQSHSSDLWRGVKIAVLTACLAALPFTAAFSQVLNPSFEADPFAVIPPPSSAYVTYNSSSVPMITDWTVTAGTIDLHHSSHGSMGCPPGGGSYHIDLNPNGSITQAVNVVAGTTYNFSFWRSVHAQVSCGPVNATVDISGAGGTLFNNNYSLSAADKPWVQEATSFTATATGIVNITFSAGGSCYSFGGMLVDLISLEPGTSCSDECFWKVTGNNINSSRNIFGTLTQDDVRIKTSNQDRGIFTADGLLGWNTMNPTAYLHVFCDGHNKEDGHLSDVRFERLEKGDGNILVINQEGYVLDSKIPLSAVTGKDVAALSQNLKQEKERNDRLERELQEVKARVDLLLGSDAQNAGSHLYQNTPNPSNGETAIPYFIDQVKGSAFILIADANGKEMARYAVNGNGRGTVMVRTNSLSQGVYFYTLIVDGREVDTKRMVIAK